MQDGRWLVSQLLQTSHASCMAWGQFLFKIGLFILFLSWMCEQALAFLPGCLSFLPSFLLLMGTRAWAHDPFLSFTFVCSLLPQHTQARVEHGSASLWWKTKAAANTQGCRQFLSAKEVQFTSSVPGYTTSAIHDIPSCAQQLRAHTCADTVSPPQSWKRRTHEKPRWILPLPNAHSCFIFFLPSFLFL